MGRRIQKKEIVCLQKRGGLPALSMRGSFQRKVKRTRSIKSRLFPTSPLGRGTQPEGRLFGEGRKKKRKLGAVRRKKYHFLTPA